MVNCRTFVEQDRARWNAFVSAHPYGSPFHLIAWRDTLQTTFGYEPRYLLVEDAQECIVGILPLFFVDNIVTGRVLISTPFAVYGGILAANDGAHYALAAQAKALAERLDVQYLELRNIHTDQRAGFNDVDRYASFTMPVGPASPNELLAAIPQKTRNLVRKSLKHDFKVRSARDLDTFYGLLALTYRKHGTPLFRKSFFETLLENFGPLVDMREILLDGRPVAASLNLLFREEMPTYYAASDPAALAAAPNNFMYFDHLLWAGNHGFRVFDFGRSKVDTGCYQFKKHFGATARPLPYEVMLVRRREMPNFTPKNPKFAMAARLWQKIPLPMTRLLGPALISLFP